MLVILIIMLVGSETLVLWFVMVVMHPNVLYLLLHQHVIVLRVARYAIVVAQHVTILVRQILVEVDVVEELLQLILVQRVVLVLLQTLVVRLLVLIIMRVIVFVVEIQQILELDMLHPLHVHLVRQRLKPVLGVPGVVHTQLLAVAYLQQLTVMLVIQVIVIRER